MKIVEALMVALVCFSIVIVGLAALYAIIRLFSAGIEFFTGKNKPAAEIVEPEMSTEQADDFSTGELKLINVDEKTAAMIMAIISDESGIPLSELCFKSIRLIENNVNE